ncbi:MBL fold metallo-hydrolase [bacterium]|jgi:hydroxyacylglutathione hydrolase|nr:MBL fold metallo-hydrolase [bacterium]
MSIEYQKITLPTPYPVGPIHIYYFVINGVRILFDSGPPTTTAINVLKAEIDLKQLDYLFITHFHPDHYGGAHIIEQLSPAQIIFSKYDLAIYEYYDLRVKFLFAFLSQLGVTTELIAALEKTFSGYKNAIPLPKNFQILEESQDLTRDLGISFLTCPGHSQSDIIYQVDDFCITGDTLLRDIFQTPLLDLNLSTKTGRFLNYENYCQSISILKSIEHQKILTAHNEAIVSVDYQIQFYYQKIIEKAEKLKPILNQKKSVYEIMMNIFPFTVSKPFLFYVKLSELLFIKDYLNDQELLKNALTESNIMDFSS